MVIGNLGEIKAVAFDIDGTLYKNWQLNFRITGHFLRHIYFFAHYGLARKDLRKISQVDDFSKVQAGFMANPSFEDIFCTNFEAAQIASDYIKSL